MNVSLTPELEKMINAKVSTGRYHSASEVVREALRLLEEQEQVRRWRMEELRREIDRGIEQIERGEVSRFNAGEIKAEGRKRLAKQRKA